MKRIAVLLHMETAEISPGPSNGIEFPAAKFFDKPGRLKRLIDDFARLLHRSGRQVDEAQGTKGQCDSVADLATANVDELKTAAAQIADDAIGIGDAGHDAKSGEFGLLLSRKNIDLGAQGLFGPDHEIRTVLGLARRGRGDGENLLSSELPAQGAKSAQGAERPRHRLIGHESGRRDTLAKAAEEFFVEKRRRAAPQPVINDQAHRVGADVDDGYRFMLR